MEHAIGTPCWADLMTSDAGKAQSFYAAVLGWDYDIQPEDYGGYAMAKASGDNVAGIGKIPPGSEMPSAWTVYLAVDDVEAVVEKWTAEGGQVLNAAMEVPAMGHMAIMADPTGGAVGLWQPINHHGFDVIGPPGATCWYELNTRDNEAARDFFAEVFGLTPQRMEGMNYYTLHDDERPRFGILQMDESWAGLPPHWMVYFAVADVEAATATVKAEGGTVSHGPFDSPQGPMAVCIDPMGAPFMIITPAT